VNPPDWRPAASLEALRLRAWLLAATRLFFADRGVLEVETPALAAATAPDPHLLSFATRFRERTLFLQTSPEHAMKRLLAAGSGPIFQLGRAFRDGESGRRHNPEFTLLEWYRPGFDHHALIGEVNELLAAVLGSKKTPAERLTYRDAFRRHAGVDPLTATLAELIGAARESARPTEGVEGAESVEVVTLPDLGDDRDAWLDLLMVSAVQDHLGRGRTTYLYDYPASQAALSRVRTEPDGTAVAERFEVFIEGIELANGFHELTDPAEQRRRFEADRAARREQGLPDVPLDEHLLAALASGMPACAGVALGLDRLVMLAAGAETIDDVLAFPIDRA